MHLQYMLYRLGSCNYQSGVALILLLCYPNILFPFLLHLTYPSFTFLSPCHTLISHLPYPTLPAPSSLIFYPSPCSPPPPISPTTEKLLYFSSTTDIQRSFTMSNQQVTNPYKSQSCPEKIWNQDTKFYVNPTSFQTIQYQYVLQNTLVFLQIMFCSTFLFLLTHKFSQSSIAIIFSPDINNIS